MHTVRRYDETELSEILTLVNMYIYDDEPLSCDELNDWTTCYIMPYEFSMFMEWIDQLKESRTFA